MSSWRDIAGLGQTCSGTLLWSSLHLHRNMEDHQDHSSGVSASQVLSRALVFSRGHVELFVAVCEKVNRKSSIVVLTLRQVKQAQQYTGQLNHCSFSAF